ncbi:MAG: hypothetical protein KR126chlam6_00039 [Candidatus Anoxychlamydiales bacterium]|nr:hypothetical protein [Candidatus Anoxychlamydiales bacterium]
MSCFSFSQPVASFGNCLGAVATQASNAFSSLTSKSVLEHTTDVVSKTVQTARSIPTYITYSPEGSQYMRSINTLVPGALFVASGASFMVYAHKTDSNSKKIAAYLLGAASIVYGALQIVDYLDISSCIAQEIEEKFARVQDPKTSFVPDSLKVEYDPVTQRPLYWAEKTIRGTDYIQTVTGQSRC